MVIWIILLAMTAAAVMAVLWPLSRHRAVATAGGSGHAVLPRADRRDRARPGARRASAERGGGRQGRSRPASAAGDGRHATTAVAAVGEPALRRRRAASTLALSIMPILALATYGDLRLAATAEPAARRADAAAGRTMSISCRPWPRSRAHLAKNPQDGRGWEVIAPVYVRMGRMDDAVKAYEAAIRSSGAGCRPLRRITARPWCWPRTGSSRRRRRQPSSRRVKLDPASPKAALLSRPRRRAGRAGRQGQGGLCGAARLRRPPMRPGRRCGEAGARRASTRLRAARLRAQIGPEAIAGMVAGLASRLEAQGGTAEEWARLMRSYAVLGQRDKAVGRSPARQGGAGAGRRRP